MKQPAEPVYLHQARKTLRFFWMAIQSFQQPPHGLVRTPKIHLQEGVDLMSRGEIRIEAEGTLKCGFRQLWKHRIAVSELVEKPATSAQPGPCRSEAWIFRKTGPVQIPRQQHRL